MPWEGTIVLTLKMAGGRPNGVERAVQVGPKGTILQYTAAPPASASCSKAEHNRAGVHITRGQCSTGMGTSLGAV